MLKTTIRNIYLKNYRFKGVKVLGRVACLGTDVLKLLNFERGLNNHQKSRIDYLLDIDNNKQKKVKAKEVLPYLAKPYIFECIQQQEKNFFCHKRPSFIFIDSFSELTDQLFISKTDHTRFLANYSDVNHSKNFKDKYDAEGLLRIETLDKNYKAFFERVFKKYPNVPIFFIHFPTKLDQRQIFKDRGNAIMSIIDNMSSKEAMLHSIKVEDDLVLHSENESDELRGFPYHYSRSTYQALSLQITTIINEKGYIR